MCNIYKFGENKLFILSSTQIASYRIITLESEHAINLNTENSNGNEHISETKDQVELECSLT